MYKRILILSISLLINLGLIYAQFDQNPILKEYEKHSDGFYYKFHQLNVDSVMLNDKDIVSLILTIRTDDSTLVSSLSTYDQMMEPIFKGDFYSALGILHVGDSASFILNADSMWLYYFSEENPFPNQHFFMDIKLDRSIPEEEFKEQQALKQKEFEAIAEKNRLAEDSLIQEYLRINNITKKPTESGLILLKNKKGRGKLCKLGDEVTIHCRGMFLDNTEFLNSKEDSEPIKFILGNGIVIPGFEEAIQQMRKGGIITIILPSAIAYGKDGIKDSIPPYSPLIFEIELLEIE
jgi:FKBP-type peptidyl-prolyl cis-trans isomerase